MNSRTLARRAALAALFTLIAETLPAQIQIPPGPYAGRMRVRATQCSQGGNTSFSAQGAISILTQVGTSFTASGIFEVRKYGLVCQLDIDMVGTIDASANLGGTFTHAFGCPGGFSSTGDGTFVGALAPGKLAIEIDGVDRDNQGEVCHILGAFRGSGAPGPFACDSARIAAIAKMCSSALSYHSKHAKDPARDPGSVRLNAGLTRAELKFIAAFDAALQKAARKGGTATHPGPATAVSGPILAWIAALAVDITTGVNNNDRNDRALRAALIKLSARACAAALSAEAKHILKPDPIRRNQLRLRIRQGILDWAQGAIDKAARKGVTYTGFTPTQIADRIDSGTNTFVAMLH